MSKPFFVKQHDLLPVIEDTLYDSAGAVVDLTAAVSVKFIMRDPDTAAGTTKVDAAASIDADPTTGTVSYAWAGTDTDTAGTFQYEWQVTWAGSKTQTFPNPGYGIVVVTADLGS